MILSYQILTEHVRRFKRWQSYKANAILNCLEIVFWAAVAFLVVQANLSRCVGIYCTLSWVVVVLAIILRYEREIALLFYRCELTRRLSISESYTAVVSIQEFRSYKARGGKKSSNGSYQENSGDEELVNRWPGRREEHGYVQHHHPKTSQQPY